MSRKTKNKHKQKPRIVEVNRHRLEELLQRAELHAFEDGDYETLQQLLESYSYLTDAVGKKSTTIARLRELLFGTKTESQTNVTGRGPLVNPPIEPGGTLDGDGRGAPAADGNPPAAGSPPKSGPQGHGRLSAEDYVGAKTEIIKHPSLVVSANCPECLTGTVYRLQPNVVVRITGHAPLSGTVYEMEKWRCNLCGVIFAAEPPADIGDAKYDAESAAIIGVLKYGTGVPFNRLAATQDSIGVPLPAATQWEIVSEATQSYEPAYQELFRQAAQGDVLYNDDTTMKILECMGKRAESVAESPSEPAVVDQPQDNHDAEVEDAAVENSSSKETDRTTADNDTAAAQPIGKSKRQRKGTFTSGVVSTRDGQKIAMFFTGGQHAGENLADVLRQRVAELPPPIQMCDGLSRNYPKDFATIISNCLAHARRRFVQVHDQFPDPCGKVVDWLAAVYHADSEARRLNLSPEDRLALHQRESQPVMDELHAWLTRQFAERLVEPNSGLGKAIAYMLKHWDKLTLFLRQAGAPLDNNICERALKMAILHRKNALFYKTRKGARVGDLHMTLIHTCRLCGASPMDYLVELQKNADEVARQPDQWLPWNYEETLLGRASPEHESPTDALRRQRRERQAKFKRRAK